jgi:hypothetical protein
VTSPHRTVIESQEFSALSLELEPDVQRLDAQMEGVVWAISRNAEAFPVVAGDIRVIETFALGQGDEYVFVYFRVDNDDTVTLLWIVKGSDVTAAGTMINVP